MGKAVVTGASGFIGSHLVDALIGTGAEVIGIDIKPPHRQDYEFLEHDIRHPLEPIEGAETWYHLAALTSPWQSVSHPQEYMKVNDAGTTYVLNAALLSHAKHFVFVSTSALYGEVSSPRCACEDDGIPNDITPYASTKALGERTVGLRAKVNELGGAVLRLGNIYGPRQDPKTEAGVVAIFLEALLRESPEVTIFGEGGIRDFVYIDDCVWALIEAGRADTWLGVLNIGTGVGTSVWQILRELEELMGVRARLTRQPHRPGETGRTVLDPHRAHLLGIVAPTPLREGLVRTWDWFTEPQPKARAAAKKGPKA